MLICKLCNKKFKSITNTHLKYKHNIICNEYLKIFPGEVCKIVSEEEKRKIGDKNKGKKASPETIQKLRDSHLGVEPPNKGKKGMQIGWSKGMTKETNEGVARISQKMMGNTNSKGPKSEETGRNISNAKKGKPLTSQHKNALKLAWADPEVAEKRIQAVLKSSRILPNNAELLLLSILNKITPTAWEYVGNGKIIIGGRSPDFKHRNYNKLIEFQGCYWHGCIEHFPNSERTNDFPTKNKIYKSHGYDSIEIWEHELKYLDSLKQKILNFTEE